MACETMTAGSFTAIELPLRTDFPTIRTQFEDVLDIGHSFSAWAGPAEEFYGEMSAHWKTLPTQLTIAEPLASMLYQALDGPTTMAMSAAAVSRRLARACFYLYDDAHLLPKQIETAGEDLVLLRQRIVLIAEQVAADPTQEDDLRSRWWTYEEEAQELRARLAAIERAWDDAKHSYRVVVQTLMELPPLTPPLTGARVLARYNQTELVSTTLPSGHLMELASDPDDESGTSDKIVAAYWARLNQDRNLDERWHVLTDEEICDEQRGTLASVKDMDEHELDAWCSEHPNMLSGFADHPLPPVEMREWWNGLDAQTQERLCTHAPILIGNLEGIPYTDRDHALRSYVDDDANWPSNDERKTLQRSRIRDQLALDHGTPILLVALDPRDDTNANSLSFCLGDPDHAQAATQLAFGMKSDFSDPDQNPAAGERSSAEGIYFQMKQKSNGRPQAVFINFYDSPNLTSEPSSGQARTAAKKMSTQAQTMRALANADGRPLMTTGVGHSYGSTTIVESVADSPQGTYDNIVTLGSAGITDEGKETLENDSHLRLFCAQHPDDGTATFGRDTSPLGHPNNPADLDKATVIDPGARATHVERMRLYDRSGPGFTMTEKVTESAHDANVSAGGPTEPGGFNPTGYGYLAPNSTPSRQIAGIAWEMACDATVHEEDDRK